MENPTSRMEGLCLSTNAAVVVAPGGTGAGAAFPKTGRLRPAALQGADQQPRVSLSTSCCPQDFGQGGVRAGWPCCSGPGPLLRPSR